LWSSAGSKYPQARALRALILPSLCRYADAYFAGHEHTLEVHTDDCRDVEDARTEPLPVLVSGAAAKQRPLHRPFMAYQQRTNPQLTTLYTRGMVWGFLRVVLTDDSMRIEVVSTPSAGEGVVVREAEFSFPRRSGGSPAGSSD
jgi:hypothetical protein